MGDSVVTTHFGKDHAPTYDERAMKFAPVRDALDFLTRMVLRDLPANARILCVGAGTGSDLIHLARAFPEWRFTAVEPSLPMLEICRRKAEEAGIASRCEYHAGYLDTFVASEGFDAATSLFVSHFLVDSDRRRDYFREIAKRLRPGAYVINADLASDLDPQAFRDLFDVWWRTHAGSTAEAKPPSEMGWGSIVAVSSPREIEGILAAAGFTNPICFYQALFIRAWYARTPSADRFNGKP